MDAANSPAPPAEAGRSGQGMAPPAGAPSALIPTSADRAKVEVLDQILISRNDNDPRLDTDFRSLTPASKELFEQKYQSIVAEKRNERGTIVHLLGKNMVNPEDVAFLGGVLTEKPCLSLADCGHDSKDQSSELNEVGTTLAYPQLVVLYQFERALDARNGKGSASDVAHPTPAAFDEMKRRLEQATRSPVPSIAQKAQQLLSRF